MTDYPNKKVLINNLLSGIGAFLCISCLAFLNLSENGNVWLIPPFGASMVLVMAVHESPLAQPKNVLLGHILSAMGGVLIYSFMGVSALSLGLSVGLAVFLMASFKVIHPPAGANPIIAVLGGEGLDFILMPVAIGALFIVLFAIVYNKILKRNYP
ncbi:MAG: HPP family protein [SAR86 cluster bacterium]|jgi:CBS-domain-containing membrane protein|uniref:HPP family protein n=1 Tax=SAR86 cluster bacterium TaxID=2030880 RepID=A0A520MEU7_9GAMM|nr:MAG: HPP family protein [SAR86 cluster bacterium]|tara:strand:+ start:119 stop:586 length:468 start_codon:yes stop_codon:yes gene_type:complete